MEIKLRLNYKDNTHQIEEEEKFKFLQCLLEMLGFEDEILQANYSDLTIEEKINFSQMLDKNKLRVIDTGDVEVYMEDDLLARWHKPTYKLKRDFSKDIKNQLYQEMVYNFYTIFDEDIETSE